MAGRPKKIDDNKVFDISRPNRAKPMGTSRPVITNANDKVIDAMVNQDATNETVALSVPTAPSISKKTIKPLSDAASEKSETTADIKVEIEKEVKDAISSAPELPKEVVDIKTDDESEAETPSAVDELAEDKADDLEEDKSTENTDTQTTSDDSTEISSPETAEDSDKDTEEKDPDAEVSEEAATIEAVVDQSSAKKVNSEKQLNPEIDLTVKDLIESKKYFVPLSHDSGKKKHGLGVWVLVLLLMAVAGVYLAVDADLIDLGFKLPFELIRN